MEKAVNGEKILTISIAAYNMEKYIENTLDSVLDKRILDDIEVFVVDDGGTDRTYEIACKYAEKYPHSIYPVHKKNGGYGTTVNYSVENASGKYFKLLDGDDWFDRQGLYDLVQTLKKTGVDIVFSGIKRGPSKDKMEDVLIPMKNPGKVLDVQQIGAGTTYGMSTITYKTELIRQSKMKLPGGIFYSDTVFSIVPFVYAKTCLFLDETVYCYRWGREGQSMGVETMKRHIHDFEVLYEQLAPFCKTIKEQNNPLYDYAVMRTARTIYAAMIKCLMLENPSRMQLEKIKNLENRVKNEVPDIYSMVEKCGLTGKVLRVLRKTNYSAYWGLSLIAHFAF